MRDELKTLVRLLLAVACLAMLGCGTDAKAPATAGGAGNPLVDDGKWTLLHSLTYKKDIDGLVALLDKPGVDVNVRAPGSKMKKTSALHIACAGGDMRVIELLLKYGADVNAREANGTTPLHNAISRGDLALVELLLEKKAEVNVYSFYVSSPLKLSREKGYTDITKLLESRGAKEN